MAVFNAENLSAAQLINTIAGKLERHRAALSDIAELHAWSATVSAADLSAAPISMDPGDANAVLSAISDAYAEFLIHTTGLPPGTYPQPPSAYVYADSQNRVIGPLW